MAKIPEWLRGKKIGVLYGGRSEEREISKLSGRAVLRAFRDLKLNVVGINAKNNLAEKIRRNRIDYCFIALHGKYGEDGTVQGLCEMMGIPYSGSGVLASALSMNKVLVKELSLRRGIPTPDFTIADDVNAPVKLKMPVVVKPVGGGSAIGVRIVKEKAELRAAIRNAFKYSDQVMIEKFVQGIEVTASILGERVLPVIEIVPKKNFYDFQAKYVRGMSDHILPARIPEKIRKRVQELALKIHCALGCRAFSRVDFIIDANEKPWLLEINSIPGMTATSLFPEAARAAGISFPEMLLEVIRHTQRE